VVVWPVVVQGDQAAAQVAAAIAGFNAIAAGGAIPRPDVLIVARGGGSVEDLWAFNDEALARVAAASAIPLISAVGHETDTTLIDFVADRRAPTPTAAAEIATPVLAELRAGLADQERRLIRIAARFLDERRHQLAAAARGLPRPADVLALASQRFDLSAGRLSAALAKNAAVHERELVRVATRLSPSLLTRRRQAMADQLANVSNRLRPAADRRLARAREVLSGLDKLRLTLNPDGPLARGFARVHHANGALARTAAELRAGEGVRLVFKDGDRGALVDGEARAPVRPAKRAASVPSEQGDLF
jgi:exodeoxyribonuclease VII large subunit